MIILERDLGHLTEATEPSGKMLVLDGGGIHGLKMARVAGGSS